MFHNWWKCQTDDEVMTMYLKTGKAAFHQLIENWRVWVQVLLNIIYPLQIERIEFGLGFGLLEIPIISSFYGCFPLYH